MRCEAYHKRTMTTQTMKSPWRTKALALCACCMLFVFFQRCEAQNLVPNPSFEILTDTCPCNVGFQGTAKPMFWEKWNQSPEYFNACVGQGCTIDTLIDVPQNGFGFQYPLDGDAYVGMAAYDGNGDFREYVGCQLTEPLQVGVTYTVSFYTNVATGGNYWDPTWACNNMGVLFTMQPNIWTDLEEPPFALRNYAHVFSAVIISDTLEWTLVSGSFVADSAYLYMVLGNFFSDALTDTMHLQPGPSLAPYYFVDAVCVTSEGQACPFVDAVHEHGTQHMVAGPNPVDTWFSVDMGSAIGVEWSVFDGMGRWIASGVSRDRSLELDVRDWSNGQYALVLQIPRREIVRFVVVH